METTINAVKQSNFWANLFKKPTAKGDLETVLKSMPPFAKLRSKYISFLTKIIHHRVYSSNEFIFHEGDPGVALYIILEGEVRIYQTDSNQKKNLLITLKRGDFFGELALIDGEVRSASAMAEKDSRIAVIFKPDLDQFIDRFPKKGILVLRGISQIIATRLRSVNQDFMELTQK